MKSWQVDRHIDNSCPGSPQPQKATSSAANNRGGSGFGSARSLFQNPPTPTKAPERLPALAYSMLKDTALRKKMGELGLSTAGSRQMLEKRHQEWITLWNANCDSAKPKRRSELMHDLEVWERTMGSRAPTMSRAANMGAQIKDKDFDGAAWATKHDTSFKDLIAKARGSRNKAVQKEDEPRGNGEPESVRDDGRGVNGTETVPDVSEGAVVDLTGPPSSQVELPDSPLKPPRRPPASSDVGLSPILGREVSYPFANSVPTYGSPPGPERAPSR